MKLQTRKQRDFCRVGPHLPSAKGRCITSWHDNVPDGAHSVSNADHAMLLWYTAAVEALMLPLSVMARHEHTANQCCVAGAQSSMASLGISKVMCGWHSRGSSFES